MCQKRSTVEAVINGRKFRLDPCMRDLILELNQSGIKTLGCCCGHGKYPRTVVVQKDGVRFEYFSKVPMPRVRRFYLTDKTGFYYIPELI